MIQFNLLPDVKLEYIKARRSKQLVMLISVAVAGTAFTLLVLLFINVRLQAQHIQHLTWDIDRDAKTLKETPNLDKILTIQNQLNSLPNLHKQKQVTSRFYDYITLVTPNLITISKTTVDFDNTSMLIQGTSPSFLLINQYVDTLKFTDYKVSGENEEHRAFSEVVLKTFGQDEKAASYQIELKFDPTIFDNTKQVSLNVPKITTTRSATEKPQDVFEQQAAPGSRR